MKGFAFIVCLISLSIQLGTPPGDTQKDSKPAGSFMPGVFRNVEGDKEPPVPKVFRHIFPHTANGQGGGLAISSSVILINNSGTDAHGTVHFRDSGGLDFDVVTDRGPGSQFDFSLFPGETYRLQTDGSGSTKSGWIEVVSDIELSGSGTFTVFDTRSSPADASEPGAFLSEVGIADSTPSTSVMIYVDTTEGRNTGFAVCNPSETETVNLTYELRELDGTVIESRQDSLAPLNQKSEFVTQTFAPAGAGTSPAAVDFTGFRGLLVIESDGPSVAVTNLRTRGVQFTSLPFAPWREASNLADRYYFPRIGDGIFGPYLFQTSFVLMNHSPDTFSGTLFLTTAEGEDMILSGEANTGSEIAFDVPAGGAWVLTSDGSTDPGVIGWAKVESGRPLVGTAVFTVSDVVSGDFISEVGIPDSPSASRLTVFAEVSGETDTGLGLTNLGDSERSFLVRLIRNPQGDRTNCITSEGFSTRQFGNLVAEKRMRLGPRGHTGFFLSQVFSDVPEVQQRNFVGRAEVLAPGPGITLRTRGTFWTSLPAARPIQNPFDPRIMLEASTGSYGGTILEGSSPYFCVNISQDPEQSLFRKAAIEFDQLEMDFAGIEEGWEIVGYSIAESYGYQAIGRLFATDATPDSAKLFTVLSVDGVEQSCPYAAEASNLPGGGIRLEIENNPAGAPMVRKLVSKFCFDAGFVRIPDGSGITVTILEEYESFEQTLDAGDTLTRNGCWSFGTVGLHSANPRIDSVIPTRAVAGSEVEVLGAGFGANPDDNSVTLTGWDHSEAIVLEASSNRLKLRLPDGFEGTGGTGILIVKVGEKYSNQYLMHIPFAPIYNLELGSLQAGTDTTLSFQMTQREDELGFMEVILKPSSGQWITDGWTVGESIGTLDLERLTRSGFLIGLYDLVVQTSGPDRLVLDVFGSGEDPFFEIEIINGESPSLRLHMLEIEQTQVLYDDMSLAFQFSQPVLSLPVDGGAEVKVEMEIVSVPERNKAIASSLIVTRVQSFSTQ